MGYITLIFLIGATALGVYKYKNVYNPMTLFFGYWTLLIFLAIIHLYNFYELSSYTYTLFFIGLFSIFIGYCFTGNRRVTFKIGNKASTGLGRKTYNYHLLLIVNILLMVFIVIRVLILLNMISSGRSWWSIRLIASGNDEGSNFLSFWGSNFMYNLYTYMVAPVMYMEAPMFVIMIYNSKYRNWRLIALMLGNFVLFSIMTVSRNLMSFLVVYFIVGYFVFNKTNNIKVRRALRKMRKFIPIVLVILIAGIWRISSLRNTEESLFETLYIYMVGGLSSIEYRIKSFTYPMYTLGLYTLRGFIRPFFLISHMLGFNDPTIYQTVIQIAQDCEIYIPIGYDVRMNAYATIFYSLYRDGGYIGIVIGSLLFGWLMKVTYNSLIQKKDLRSYVIYFLIVQQIFFSMARFYSVFPTRAFSYIWALLLINQKEDDDPQIKAE